MQLRATAARSFALLAFGLAALAPAQHSGPPTDTTPIDWRAEEAGLLSNHVQLTSPRMFARAGEQYFDPTMTWIIFQAYPIPAEGDEPSQFYDMFIARLIYDSNRNIIGAEKPIQLSAPGTSNTCGWFHPQEPWRIIFGSTVTPPALDEQPGFRRGTREYVWKFPREMEVTTTTSREVWDSLHPNQWSSLDRPPATPLPTPLFTHPEGYDAECAYSPDGRHIVYGSLIDEETKNLDLFVFDTQTRKSTKIVEAPGYDGGPFFSPDGLRICYRSDRENNNLLQLFVADLAFDSTGAITGIVRETQLTKNEHVNWAPFWHPSGEFLIYTTSEIDHTNYEVFSIEVPPAGESADISSLAKKRITHASGFDGLPVFSPDGQWMLWTSQRGPKLEGQPAPTSQVWTAKVTNLAPE